MNELVSGPIGRLEAAHERHVARRRARVLTEHLAEIIPPDANLLDVGCGDGEIAWMVGQTRPDLKIRGVDVLNIHGSIGMSRAAAHLAGDYGIPVSLGNTLLEIGVHLAASLPEVLYLEFSDLTWNELAQQPVRFENSKAIAPDRPGHGIELDRDALAEYSSPQ